ncbi:MAG TPA: SpoIVB peptidase S55 domain-containing protein, partial [Candidatus Obscuribacter sp.]|nr:SpoIVB peptidase S55 domain-containing protein [Candidatus Obscuribacter sp.]
MFPFLRRTVSLATALSLLSFSAPYTSLASAQGNTAHHQQDSHYNPVDKGFVERFLKASDYIPVDEIKPGMEGYGLTVFQGTKVERFQVKVIGVIKQALSGRDAILIRLSGPHMGKNNVIRGMSGSPIYIGNRLAGALSYGFDFSKEPIVGVTPVVDMLDALSFDTATGAPRHLGNKPDRSFAVPGELLPPPSLSRLQKDLSRRKSEAEASGERLEATGAPRMVPLLAPVSLSGYSSRAQEYLAAQFKDVGLHVTSGASGGLNPKLLAQKGDGDFDKDRKVVPGGAVAVMLSTGDFAGAATGTATCTRWPRSASNWLTPTRA